MLANRQTIVLGGLMQDRRSDTENGVPVLKDIPLLGRLFRNDADATEKRELLVFVTPRVVDPNEAAVLAKRYQEGYSDFQRVLTAQRARATASSRYVANQGAHINAVIDFYRALGGGWQPATAEDIVPMEVRTVMEERTDWDEMLDDPVPVAAE